MTQRTIQKRILKEGACKKLYDKIEKQFIQKHGFKPSSDQIFESIATAVEEAKLFGA